MPSLTLLKRNRVAALFTSLLIGGCGPFGYIGKVSQKSVDAFEKAKAAQAETYAPYEYWAAKAYLDRARVMMTYSEYERAFDYGSRAQQLAEAAARKAERVQAQEAKQAEEQARANPSAPNRAMNPPVPSQPALERPKSLAPPVSPRVADPKQGGPQ